MKLSISTIFIILTIFSISHSLETVDLSSLQKQVKLQWSFVSQIQHTWFKNIVNTYFTNCSEHSELKALYNCKTPTSEYRKFWRQFIEGVEQIKFRKVAEEQEDHSWAEMMTEAAEEWITVNKTKQNVQIEEAYEDISEFPENIMEFAQFTSQYKDQFEDMQKLIKWQRTEKAYLTKRDRSQDEMKSDQTLLFRKYIDTKCFQSPQSIQICTMPLNRYTYYLKDCFFYYFDQPEKFSRYDPINKVLFIKPVLDYKITKLWRDMRLVMKEHLGMGDDISLDQVEKMTPDILESVMESLVRKTMNQQKSDQQKATESEL